MSTDFAPYKKLRQRAREISFYTSSAAALSWDLETYMPAQALAFRAEQLAYLGSEAHRMFTAKQVGRLIAACEEHGFAPETDAAANVREWRKQYDRATKVPVRLVEKMERVRAHAREAWKTARAESKFRLFRPHLQKIVDLNRQMADCWGFAESPYDALVEGYETGVTAAQLRTLFATLRPALVTVLGAAQAQAASVPAHLLAGHYPIAAQQEFNRKVAAAIGFDFTAGRIDTTTHPFCDRLAPGDCRLTTRYDEKNFTQSLYGVMHEAGHGMYEQGLPGEHFGAPLGSAVSLGIHESQSRLWENHVGRSLAFWEHWHPVACEHFPDLKKLSPAQVSAAVNRVAPSFIRVEADQVTYDLHIILRFELEVKLIEGSLAVADVPDCWNAEFEKMFDLKVTSDADGCLQDIHWSIGALGYFATYTLGNLNAAQLMRRAAQDHPALERELAAGNYATLLKWLREKVHCHGSRHTPTELMRLATGEATQSKYHLDYLRQKFGGK